MLPAALAPDARSTGVFESMSPKQTVRTAYKIVDPNSCLIYAKINRLLDVKPPGIVPHNYLDCTGGAVCCTS